MIFSTPYRGFLPIDEPRDIYEYHMYGPMCRKLPELVHRKKWRDEIILYLKAVNNVIFGTSTIPREVLVEVRKDPSECEFLMRAFSYFASAYIHGHPDEPTNYLPTEIANPLVTLSDFLARPPILSYASYCLYNWKRIDPDQPIELGNIELIQNFSHLAKDHEDWFILVHVDIEAKAAKIANEVYKSAIAKPEEAYSTNALINVLTQLEAINKTMARMPEKCDPDIYYRSVRPFIFGFDKIIYESVDVLYEDLGLVQDDITYTLRGETGAQSSVMPLLLIWFGIKHTSSRLTEHLDDMLNYMPEMHRGWLIHLKKLFNRRYNLREDLRMWCLMDKNRVLLYNTCLSEIVKFRKQHFEYAVNYIQNKVTNPTGTGGTPYIHWLGKLIEETESYYLKF